MKNRKNPMDIIINHPGRWDIQLIKHPRGKRTGFANYHIWCLMAEAINNPEAWIALKKAIFLIDEKMNEQPPKDAQLIEPKGKDDSVAKGEMCDTCKYYTINYYEDYKEAECLKGHEGLIGFIRKCPDFEKSSEPPNPRGEVVGEPAKR